MRKNPQTCHFFLGGGGGFRSKKCKEKQIASDRDSVQSTDSAESKVQKKKQLKYMQLAMLLIMHM